MKIFMRHWNPEGENTALLIHGIGGGSSSWNKVAEWLTDRNYHVMAPDLSGHGESIRRARYSVQGWVNQISESVKDYEFDLMMGHSLGGLVAAGVHLKNPAKRNVFIDPAFALPSGFTSWVAKRVLVKVSSLSEAMIRRDNPDWSDEEVYAELENMRVWDARTVHGLIPQQSRKIVSQYLTLGTEALVVKPKNSLLVRPLMAAKLKAAGMKLVDVTKWSHNLHRNTFDTFIEHVNSILDPIEEYIDGTNSVDRTATVG